MMTKTAYYMQMAQEAAAQITGSKEQWTAFLTTSARLYKYPFAEQLMIYKQRPEATACAEYDLWNDRMNRYVKRGSKGIALLDMRGEQPKLRYVFDVADTGERKNSRPVQLWKMNAEHEQPIIRALDAAFDVPAGAGSLENHIMEAAERLARDYWEENRRQISDIVADSYLEGYDELNIGASFKRAAAVSIAYSVFTRTVGNADDYFEHEDFLDIFDFNTQAAANVLGTAVSEMSSQIFREIERTIRTYERDKQAERSQNYDGAELHEERRLPDSGHPVVGAGTEAPGQVREDAQSVSAGEQHAAVQSPDPDREAVPAPVGDSGDRDRTDGADDGGSSESESGTGQEIKPDGLGAAHEHAESAGRGSHSNGTYQQLNFMSLFQSEAEQIQKIDAAAENAAKEAESEKPSAFVISEDEIDRMLRTGSNFEGGKIRIYALYQQQGDAKERAAFLKAEYGLGGHSYTFMDGSRGFADYNGRGILLRNGVELDSITGRIAQKLYPQAEIKVAGFETTDRRDFYDLAVGNVPFGNYRVSDKPYDKLGFSIHNYFFAKALDQVRPGGIVAFVTSRYTMDSKNPDARKYLAQRAELLGAIRLPNNAFRANAGTDVVSDIIFLQKRDHPIDIEPDWVHLGLTSEGITLNSYIWLTTRKWCWVRLQRKAPSTARKNVQSFRFRMQIWETSCMRLCNISAATMKRRSWHRRKNCPCRAKPFRQTPM